MSLADNKKLLAAVDIGSNSIHLIIARISQGALQPIQTFRERVQLAAGLRDDGTLDDAAVARGVSCLEKMGQLLVDHNPQCVRVVATHTLRVASNRNRFIAYAEAKLGYPIEVISGAEEARLIFLGVAHSLSLLDNTLVIDIGGGSTELAVGRQFEPSLTISCRMGCVSFRDRFFARDLSRQSFARAQRAAEQELEAFLPRLRHLAWERVLATSGTAKALEKIITALNPERSKEDAITLGDLHRVRELMIDGGLDALACANLGDDRLPLIPGGVSIMIALAESLDIATLNHYDVALREGVLYELDEEMRHPDIVQRTRDSLHERYQVDVEHAQRVAASCERLLSLVAIDALGSDLDNVDSQDKRDSLDQYADLLIEASHLHEVGLQISASGLQKHSHYILLHSDMPGFTEERQLILAHLVGRYRKRLDFDSMPEFTHLSKNSFIYLVLLLRLAVIFNVSRRVVSFEGVALQISASAVDLVVPEVLTAENPLLEPNLSREVAYLADCDIALNIAFSTR